MTAASQACGPRAASLLSRFRGNVREAEFEDLLGAIWSYLRLCLTEPVQVKESSRRRTVTFMGAIRFTVDKTSGRVGLRQYGTTNGKLALVRDDKATVIDLPAKLNGFWLADRLYTAEQVNLGIAVDVEQGLLLAVVEDCAGKGIAELAAASNQAVGEVRQGRGGRGAHATFTVSNLGMFGVELFTPVLNPPETGILGVGAVVDGRIGLSLTFDHRAIDGAPAARFLDLVARELAGA